MSLKFTKAIDYLEVRKIPNSKYWTISSDFVFYIDYLNKDGKITVPVWFTTDFGSIPFPMSIFIDPTRCVSYVLHDYLYSWGKIERLELPDEKPNRTECDNILDMALEVEGMWVVKRKIVRIWLFLFWWVAFNF